MERGKGLALKGGALAMAVVAVALGALWAPAPAEGAVRRPAVRRPVARPPAPRPRAWPRAISPLPKPVARPTPGPVDRWVGRGLRHQAWRENTPAGPMAVQLLRLSPQLAELRVLLPQRAGGGFARATTSAIAKGFGAAAAINGAFFNFTTNEPAGLLVSEGQIVCSSPLNRSVFGLRYDGTPFIDDASVRAAVLLDDGRELPLAAVNHAPKPGALTLYSPHWGPTTRSPISASRYEAALDANGVVVEVSNGELTIPRGGWVVSGQGAAQAQLSAALPPGAKALVYTRLSGVWEGVRFALGAGPTIVHQGREHVTWRQEAFGAHVSAGRAPRSAIGYAHTGEVLMLTIDGRRPQHSIGATLRELARLMIRLGAVEAINLDGGGSTTMVVKGQVTNLPSGGGERPVGSVLGAFLR